MAFLDPESWANEYLEEEGHRWKFEQYIEDEIEKYKNEAFKRFHIISHPDYAEAIAGAIAYGYTQDLEESKKIVRQLLLNDKHIAALNNDARELNDLLSSENLTDLVYEKCETNL